MIWISVRELELWGWVYYRSYVDEGCMGFIGHIVLKLLFLQKDTLLSQLTQGKILFFLEFCVHGFHSHGFSIVVVLKEIREQSFREYNAPNKHQVQE